jgi:IS5 family transposase
LPPHQPTLWDALLPVELLVLPVELGRVDVLLDDPVFFAPFAAYFDARIGRPSIPVETYLRLMFLKFRYRLGYESLCRWNGSRPMAARPGPARGIGAARPVAGRGPGLSEGAR